MSPASIPASISTELAPGAALVGVDEAGRGPIAGPVTAAAVILDPARPIAGLRDSKKLSAGRRVALAEVIRTRASAWAMGWSSVAEIEQMNILEATLLAMKRAVERLPHPTGRIMVDGNRLPDWSWPATAVVGGDDLIEEISAASILAKVARDRYMTDLHTLYPEYGFDRNAGYPTREHVAALRQFGALIEHRRGFKPVRDVPLRHISGESCESGGSGSGSERCERRFDPESGALYLD